MGKNTSTGGFAGIRFPSPRCATWAPAAGNVRRRGGAAGPQMAKSGAGQGALEVSLPRDRQRWRDARLLPRRPAQRRGRQALPFCRLEAQPGLDPAVINARRTNVAGPRGSFRSSLSDPGEHRRAFVRRELAYRRRFEDVSDPQSLVGPLLIRNDGDTPDQRTVMHADPRADGAGARCPSLQVLPIEDEMLHTLPIKDGIGLREVSVEILLRDGARHLHGDQISSRFWQQLDHCTPPRPLLVIIIGHGSSASFFPRGSATCLTIRRWQWPTPSCAPSGL